MTEHLKYLLLLFPLVGVGLFIFGLIYRRRLKQREVCYQRTRGTVVDSVAGLAGGFDTSPVYHPVVEYFVGSSRFTVTGNTGYGSRKKNGARLTVIFDPSNPSAAFILEDYYFAANGLIAVGGTFILFGLLLVYELIL